MDNRADTGGLESFESHNGRLSLPVEFDDDDHRTPIAITHFDFAALDAIQDAAREAIAHGRFDLFLLTLRRSIEDDIRIATVTQIDGFASHFRNRYMGYDLLRDVCGLAALDGDTTVTLAKRWGVSKEAWQQNRERMRKLIATRKTRTMRDDKARKNMRMRNYRKA